MPELSGHLEVPLKWLFLDTYTLQLFTANFDSIIFSQPQSWKKSQGSLANLLCPYIMMQDAQKETLSSLSAASFLKPDSVNPSSNWVFLNVLQTQQ